MKFLWFHLMPYKELPDDFKDKHPSVWVDIHSSLFDPRRAHHAPTGGRMHQMRRLRLRPAENLAE